MLKEYWFESNRRDALNPIEEKRCIKEIITRAGLKDLLRSDYSSAEACRGKHEVLLNSDSSRTSLKMDFGQVY